MTELQEYWCFFCGKSNIAPKNQDYETEVKGKECDDPICREMYRMVRADKIHPFFVTRKEAELNLQKRVDIQQEVKRE